MRRAGRWWSNRPQPALAPGAQARDPGGHFRRHARVWRRGRSLLGAALWSRLELLEQLKRPTVLQDLLMALVTGVDDQDGPGRSLLPRSLQGQRLEAGCGDRTQRAFRPDGPAAGLLRRRRKSCRQVVQAHAQDHALQCVADRAARLQLDRRRARVSQACDRPGARDPLGEPPGSRESAGTRAVLHLHCAREGIRRPCVQHPRPAHGPARMPSAARETDRRFAQVLREVSWPPPRAIGPEALEGYDKKQRSRVREMLELTFGKDLDGSITISPELLERWFVAGKEKIEVKGIKGGLLASLDSAENVLTAFLKTPGLPDGEKLVSLHVQWKNARRALQECANERDDRGLLRYGNSRVYRVSVLDKEAGRTLMLGKRTSNCLGPNERSLGGPAESNTERRMGVHRGHARAGRQAAIRPGRDGMVRDLRDSERAGAVCRLLRPPPRLPPREAGSRSRPSELRGQCRQCGGGQRDRHRSPGLRGQRGRGNRCPGVPAWRPALRKDGGLQGLSGQELSTTSSPGNSGSSAVGTSLHPRGTESPSTPTTSLMPTTASSRSSSDAGHLGQGAASETCREALKGGRCSARRMSLLLCCDAQLAVGLLRGSARGLGLLAGRAGRSRLARHRARGGRRAACP